MRFTHACCAAMALASLAAPAHALTIVQTFTVGTHFVDDLVTFNSALGRLESVVINATAQATGDATRGSFDLPELTIPASGGLSVNIGNYSTGGETIIGVGMTGRTYFAPGSPTGGCMVTGGNAVILTGNLDMFKDRGTVAMFMGSNSGSSCGGRFPDIQGRGQILFNYSPGDPTVPEPATWAMMIAGFGLTGGAMRRKRLSEITKAA